MSQISSFKEKHMETVPKYLNFLLLRLNEKYEITDEEKIDTWKFYVEYCKENKLPHVNKNIFNRILTKRGIESFREWDKGKLRTVTKKDISVESLNVALSNWVDNSATHSGVLTIDGERYQVITKLIKISPLTTPFDELETAGKK